MTKILKKDEKNKDEGKRKTRVEKCKENKSRNERKELK